MSSSRGRIIWFLCCLTLVGGLLSASSEVSHAQSTFSFLLSGNVTDKDGAPAEGLTVGITGTTTQFTTRSGGNTPGSYDMVLLSFSVQTAYNVGDVLKIYVKDGDDTVASIDYTITAENIAASPPGAVVNIQLSGLTAELTPAAIPADGVSTATLDVSVQSGGAGVADDTLTITAEKGSVGEVTNNGDGTYTATYTAPELTLAAATSDTVTVSSGALGSATSAMITLNIVPTVIKVTAAPAVFTAGDGGTSAVTVSVTRASAAVSDAKVDVTADAGTVGDVITNNGDGTYSATYTPPTVAGRDTITAVDSASGARGSATVTVNAGAAATIVAAAQPMTVSSGAQAIITASVADASGNGVGGLSLSGIANSGTVGDFAEGANVGTYTASYTAPMVDAAGSDAVTVTAGDLNAVATINLTPEPPVTVGIIVVTGTVNKKDGSGAVSGMNVAVSVGGKAPLNATSGSDGVYSVTILDPGGNAASTGDSLSVVVTDGGGAERGRSDSVLTNEDLGTGDSPIVRRDVTTDISAASSTLVVSGAVFREASEIPISDVFDITVENANRGAPIDGKSDANGMYSFTFLETGGFAAETGDMLTVTASRDGAEVGAATYTLTSADVDAKRATVNVPTNIKASTSALSVTGTVYHEDGTVEMGAGLSVTVGNAGRVDPLTATTDADGGFEVTFFSATGAVAETGDTLTVTVMDGAAGIGSETRALTSAEVDAGRAMVNVSTTAKASTSTLVVTGSVFFVGGTQLVGPEITVEVENPDTMQKHTAVTDANGMYSVTLFDPANPVAETGDAIDASVIHGGETAGYVSHNVTAAEIDARRATVDVETTIKAESFVFNVTGTVLLEDGESWARSGVSKDWEKLTVRITNARDGVGDAEGMTNADGSYSVTFVSPGMAAAAKSGDELTCDVLVMAGSDPVGSRPYTLTTDEVVARRATDVDIKTSLTADPSTLIVVSGTVSNPDGTPAAAGVEVRLTLGSNPMRNLTTSAGGSYITTFFSSDMTVVAVGDTLHVEALDRNSGSAFSTINDDMGMPIESKHVLAQRVTFDVALIADDMNPVPVPNRSEKFVDPMETVVFDGIGSSDNVGIDTYMWDFGDGKKTAAMKADDIMKVEHQYAKAGKYTATLTLLDLAGNEAIAPINVFVGTVRLGGMALNTRHANDVGVKIIGKLLANTELAREMGGADAVIDMLRANPAYHQAIVKAISAVIPEGAIPKQFLTGDVPLIFEGWENIDLENFGNAIAAYPGDKGILNSEKPNVGRVVNGDKLDLYLVAPREDVGSVTFRFDGIDGVEAGTRDAREAVAGATFPHTFHLEEEQAITLLPASVNMDGAASAFASVTLMYRSDDLKDFEQYHNLLSRARHLSTEYASAMLSPMTINGKTVWTAKVGIEPGKIYYYYYKVTLNTPIEVSMGEGIPSMPMTEYAFPDPRNLQIQDRGIVDAILTPAMQQAIAPLLNPILNAIVAGQSPDSADLFANLGGEELIALVIASVDAAAGLYTQVTSTLDPHIDSVFTVPMVTDDQSLWYATIDLSDVTDGMHTIDANAFDSEGVQIDNRPVYGKTFMLDRSAPEYDLSVEAGESASMYMRDDGVLIATGLLTPDPTARATILLTATANASSDASHLDEYTYQIMRRTDDSMAPQSGWRPIIDADMPPVMDGLTLDDMTLFLISSIDNMLSINERAGKMSPAVQPLNMTIRGMNNNPELIVGNYGLRVIARDSVFNTSSDAEPVLVDIVPPDPDKAMIVNIEIGDCNKDGDLEDPFESGPPDENSTIFANTLSVKLSVNIERTPHPLTGLVVQYKTSHGTGMWKDIKAVDVTGVVDAVDVQWDIEDFASLIDGGGDQRVYVRAVATNKLTITDPDPAMTMIKLDDGVCPVEPEHIAVNVVPAGTNPETGGACGIITVNGYTAARTIPELASVQFVLTGPDGTERTIDDVEPEELSSLDTADLTAIVGNLVDTIAFGNQDTAAQEVGYHKWSVTLNTAPLMDSLDEEYVVNATMIGADGMEYAPIAGGSDSFLLHNGDVQTGTVITAVADAYGDIDMGEGGFHQLGGILAEGLDTPIAKFTVDPAAPDWRVGAVKLIVHARNADGSKGDLVPEETFGETVTVEPTVTVNEADMTKDSSDRIFTITVSDLSLLGAGGDYVFQALAMDRKTEPDVEAEDASFGTAVNVDNYTPPPAMITIDGRGEGMSLADFMAGHPLGYRIAQSDANAFPFSISAPGVLAGDLSVQIDGETVASDLVTLEGMRHDFSLVVSTSATDEGDHPASGTVTKRNGSVPFDLVNLAIDRVAPVITVLSPIEDAEVSALPTIHSIYNDGAGYGIAVAPTDALDVAADVEILITRLTPPDETAIPVNQDELEDTDDSVVYSRDDQLAGGAYRTDVSVTDRWGNRSSSSAEFTVVGTLPSVTILSPMADSVSDDGMPLISAALTGTGALDVVFTIDGEAIEGAVDGNSLSYTPEAPLAEGDHTVTIRVTDPDGKMAEASVTFSVELDHSPPVISQVSPLGVIWGDSTTLTVTAIDDQSGVASVSIALDGGDAVEGASRDVEGLALGQHTATATATNGDGFSDEYTWTFSVALDEEAPSIGTQSPQGVVRSANPTVSVSAIDFSGIASIAISVMGSDGAAVDGDTAVDENGTAASFNPAGSLANDTYAVAVVVTDNAGNTATADWSFTVEANYDTTKPSVDVTSPHGIVRVANPTISVAASDVSDTAEEGLSGIASIDISLMTDAGEEVAGSTDMGDGSASFMPADSLDNGTYTASAVVTDNSGNVSAASWSFVVEVVMDHAPPAIGATSPSGIVRIDMPTISVSATDDLSGVGNIDISLTAGDGSTVDGASEFDGATLATFTPSAALANDTYTASAVVTDNAGNETKGNWSFTVEVVTDTLPPTITATSPQGLVRNDAPTISVGATDDMSGVAGIEISVSDSGGQVAGSGSFDGAIGRFAPDGALDNDTYTVNAVVTDNAGNSASANWSFTLEADDASPVINLTSPQGTVRTEDPRVTVAATDDLSGIGDIEIRVFNSRLERVGGPTVFEGGTRAVFSPSARMRNDTYTVGVTVTDKAGNVTDASWSFTVQVDTTPPVISATSPLGIVRDEQPRVSVSAIDDESGMEDIQIRVLNSGYERMGGETRYTGGTTAVFVPNRNWRNDTYSVGVTATDKSGNRADASWSFVLEADHTPPVINVTSPQGTVRDETPTVSVSATDNISGIASFEIRVFDSRFGRVAGPTTFEGGTVAYFKPSAKMDNDTYSVGVKVTDKAGNTTDANWSFTVEVDKTPPTIGDTGPHGIIRSAAPRVTVSATDDFSGIKSIAIRVVNNVTFARVPGATTFQGGTFASFSPSGNMDNGVYSVGVDVTDKSGNVASTGWSFTVEVDTVPPTIAHTSPSGSVRPENPVISVAATDDLSGIANIQITVRDRNQSAVPGNTVFEGGTIGTFVPSGKLDYGTHSVGVTVKDKAGNVANATYSFTVESPDGLAMLNARNFPNPFAGATKIAFTLTRASDVSIEIFDISMRPVWHMSQRTIEASKEVVIGWNGTTSGGEKLARGVYFCQIMVHDSLNPQHAVLKMGIK